MINKFIYLRNCVQQHVYHIIVDINVIASIFPLSFSCLLPLSAKYIKIRGEIVQEKEKK